jgi:hypothetical protein
MSWNPGRSAKRKDCSWAARLGVAAAAGILYFLAAHVNLFLLTELDGVAVFWPAAGISAGMLVALGRPLACQWSLA